jgi:hypothetical protein
MNRNYAWLSVLDDFSNFINSLVGYQIVHKPEG